MKIKLSDEQWNEVYDILVIVCGAPEHPFDRRTFVSSGNDITEWRFCGSLGFGGKFWNNNGRLYVSCYREDETPEKLRAIDRANEKLEKFYRKDE